MPWSMYPGEKASVPTEQECWLHNLHGYWEKISCPGQEHLVHILVTILTVLF